MKIQFEHIRTTTRPQLESDGKLGRVYSYRTPDPDCGLGGRLVYVHVFSAEAARHREALALRRALAKQGGSI